MRARPVVWLALVAALLSLLFVSVQEQLLPKASWSGYLTGVVEEAEEDRLVLRDAELDGRAVGGRVVAYCEPCGFALEPGMRIGMQTELKPLKEPVNPHGWDDRTWWVYKKAVYTCDGMVEQIDGIAPYSLRREMRDGVLEHMQALWGDTQESGVIRALLLGDEEGITEQTQEAFRRSGAAHLMAVSGLHVGFVAALVLLAFGWMRKNSAGQILAVLVCMGLYAMVAESAFSVFRAMVMLAAGLLAGSVGRKSDGATSLAAAALAALMMEPQEILRAGFLMSVGAVAGIFMLGGRLDKLLERGIRLRWLRGSIAVSVSA